MAPASEFSEIEDVSLIENESTEEKGEVVTETVGNHTDESLDESEINSLEHVEFIKPNNNNADIQGNDTNSAVRDDDKMDSDEEDIVNQFEKTGGVLQVVKWYKETYQVGLKEAKDRVEFVLDKHGLRNISKSGSGCMVILLIALSSTLSAFFLL